MKAITNEKYFEYMEERVTLEDIEIIEKGNFRLYRGMVTKNVHPDHRRLHSLVRTALFEKIGEIVEINESWFL